jgi:hypothetical protein
MGGLKKIEKGIGKVWNPVRKVIDPLNIMDPFNILPDAKLRGKKPFSFDPEYGGVLGNALRGPTRPYTPPKMDFSKYQTPQFNYNPSGFLSQIQQGNQASLNQKTDALASANAAQQDNINSIMAQSKPPVQTNFSSPNLSGLTFGGK